MENEESLRRLLSDVADIFCREKLKSLQFLLSDVLKGTNYSDALQIFEELLTNGYITPRNISLLYDIIHFTGHFSLVDVVKRSIPNCPNLRNWKPACEFSPYRIMLFNISNQLFSDDLNTIKFCYTVRKEVTDVWTLLMLLDKQTCQIDNGRESLAKLKNCINPSAGKLIDTYLARPAQERQYIGQHLPIQASDSDGSRRLLPTGMDASGSGDTQRMDITDGLVKSNLTDVELMDLAKELGKEWRSLAVYLGFTSARIDQLISDNRNDMQTTTFCMLDAWHKMVSGAENSRRSQLTDTLKKVGRRDLAEKVESGTL